VFPKGKPHKFQIYMISTILFNVMVILWGAFVRATHSGAGCGDHWPLCGNRVIPEVTNAHTGIEFFHRATSGISLLLVLYGVAWAFARFPKGLFIRKMACVAGVSIIVEALIGAVLVLLRLVAQNQSPLRAVVISFHFVNTLVLLGSLVLIAAAAYRNGQGWKIRTSQAKKHLSWICGSVFVVGVTGAITALGDTLFPANSLAQGLSDDLNELSHFLIRIRFLHPLIAVTVGLILIRWILVQMSNQNSRILNRLGMTLIVTLLTNFGIGVLNIVWLTPVSIQMLHLGIGLIFWILMVLFWDRLASTPS
jgi:cytochrome c oxidase assembly protein subunit 15/protoheme IX farnesyltransferase